MLHQDEQLLFVLKPPGMPAQPDPSCDTSLVDWVSELVGRKVDPIHRLDRPVGGVMVFGLTPSAVRNLSRQFVERVVRKTYLGVVRGKPPRTSGTLEHYLLKQGGQARVRKGPPAQRAVLRYRVKATADNLTLLELEPETGRFHQIRAQLGAIGLPLLGDARYGARKPLKDRSIALYAYRLQLEQLTVESAPEGPPWDRFS